MDSSSPAPRDFFGELLKSILSEVNNVENKNYLQKHVVRPIIDIIFHEIRVYIIIVAIAFVLVVGFHVYVLQQISNLTRSCKEILISKQ